METDLHYLELLDVAHRIQTRKISSTEVTQALLERIGTVDRELRSYATVMAEQAMSDARRADTEIAAGKRRGPLHGVPIGVKDLCWTKGVTTMAGMPIYRDFKPTEDGTVVEKLRAGGAVILGKLQMTEGAYVDHHPDIRPPINPWDPTRWTGVSSSGSGVATAAGLCYGSIGTDTGGSIRFPSAANGVTGLKPTWGRVSRHGSFELAATLDHIGPMARSAADAGAMLSVIAGVDPKDPTASREPVQDYHASANQGVRGLRIGVDRRLNQHLVDEPTRRTLEAALEVVTYLGAQIVDIRFPDTTQAFKDWVNLCAIEVAVAHEKTYPRHKEQYGPSLAAVIEQGRALSAMEYQRIVLRRHAFAGHVQAVFDDIDVLLIASTGVAAPTLERVSKIGEEEELLGAMLRFTCPFDMTGSPTITLPGIPAAGGLPVGFQFVGRHFDEAALVRAGGAVQSVTDWHRRHPPV
ncbi:amidase [Paraburkholderia ferrariae]|uniref:Amidase n=1 Tax=Paraburkholderia ferrariae TaxID=386056 RepID=A0ABU9RNB1_9BURK